MQRKKLFSIITIICFCTIILIPLGLALMWFTTEWKKKRRIIITSILAPLYVALVVLLLFLEPSYNTSGLSLPGSYSQGYTAFDSTGGKPDESEAKQDKKSKQKGEGALFEEEDAKRIREEGDQQPEEERLPSSLKRKKGKVGSQVWYTILFFLLILILIILQNLRNSRKKAGYENPYVDTNQYKLPFNDDSKMPMVHFLGLRLNQGERIYFAVNTTQKNNEGDFVVTSQRVLIYSREGDYEFPLSALTAIQSISNTVFQLTSGERKYYIFVPENQMKYALAVVRWAFGKC